MNEKLNTLFFAEGTLGRLAVYLRMMGFDTVFENDPSAWLRFGARTYLTRKKKVFEKSVSGMVVFIRSDDPEAQAAQVVRELGLSDKDLPGMKLFSRCVKCNAPIEIVEKDDVFGMVPQYIFDTHTDFRRCPACRKVYWRGDHVDRGMKLIKEIFRRASENE